MGQVLRRGQPRHAALKSGPREFFAITICVELPPVQRSKIPMLKSIRASQPPASFLEALEPRIAPAIINAGPAFDDGVATGGIGYISEGTPFQQAGEALVSGPAIFDPPVAPADAEHFFIDLRAGDTLRIYNDSTAFADFAKVTAGRVFAFFYDSDGDKAPQANELTGLVLSAGAKVSVSGDVGGSILATLDAKTGVFSTDSLVSKKQNIAALTVSGNVGQFDPVTGALSFGNIVSGGNIDGLSVGRVNIVQSGAPAPLSYNLGGVAGVGDGVIGVFDPGVKQAGGNLSGIKVNSADVIVAGAGGQGGAGGKITNLQVLADGNGIVIGGGAGGAAGPSSTLGGAGGSVSQVVIGGVADSTANALIQVYGGTGGASTSGQGGLGGSLGKVYVGYEYNNARQIEISEYALLNNVLLLGGDGGQGVRAGAGGGLNLVNVVAAPGEDSGANAEIRLWAGQGGALVASGSAAGAGGSISNFKIQNLDPDAAGISDVSVKAGDASTASAVSVGLKPRGAAGGSIINPVAKAGETWLVGQSFEFEAGDGSSTAGAGGAGGSVTNLYASPFTNQFLESLAVTGGAGGNSASGAGGAGGRINAVYVPISELSELELSAGDGGTGSGGRGGAGGSVANVQIFDQQDSVVLPIVVEAGAGGAGLKAGGAGGAVSGFSYFGQLASLRVAGGAGGSGTDASVARASGGNGGALSGIALSVGEASVLAFSNLTAGSGGDAVGSGVGGKGGDISKGNLQTHGEVQVSAGQGGKAGEKGRVGAGGSLGSSNAAAGLFARSSLESVAFLAGQAGVPLAATTPGTGAAGGGISNAVASAAKNISFTAGNGSVSGAGGTISRAGFYGAGDFSSSFAGNLVIAAGLGGDPLVVTARGGAGGSINSAVGTSSSTDGATVLFEAGRGGGVGSASGSTGGLGGSVNGVSITAGSAPFSVLAGHGGDGQKFGGKGGSVQNIASTPAMVVRAVAAGDGGDVLAGTAKGAAGGTVNKVDVAGDLGLRSGANFGFATDGSKMGGVFAGRGGINESSPLDVKLTGANGNVTNLTAQAISAIVAGRSSSPLLVNLVDGIYLRGNTAAAVDSNGGFTNFGVANLAGGKASSATADPLADQFHYAGGVVDPSNITATGFAWNYETLQAEDGLIAATTLTAKRNFTPLAFLTNAAPASSPADYRLFVPELRTPA